MKNFRNDKKTIAHFTSFAECAKTYGKKNTKVNIEELGAQRKEFLDRYKCKTCGSQMTYIGGNQMVCSNDACNGYALLNAYNAKRAGRLFN